MRALLSAAAVVAALTGAASAEPVKLDEAKLGDVAAGVVFGPGPIAIDIDVTNAIMTPTNVVNDLDITNQIGGALAINTNAVIATLASDVSGTGAAMAAASFDPGPPAMP
jgi:hypothetical protein